MTDKRRELSGLEIALGHHLARMSLGFCRESFEATQGGLAKRLHTTQPRISESVGALRKAGLLQTRPAAARGVLSYSPTYPQTGMGGSPTYPQKGISPIPDQESDPIPRRGCSHTDQKTVSRQKGEKSRHAARPASLPFAGPENRLATGGVLERIFEHWNSIPGLVTHRALKPPVREAIAKRLKDGYTEAELMQAATRYAELKQHDAAPGYGRWGLRDLLSRDGGDYLDKLLDENWEGFVQRGNPASNRRGEKFSPEQDFEGQLRKALGGRRLKA